MPETWYKEYCPKCDTVNWICNGDESDLSSVDIEGFKCRKCGHIEYLGLDFEFFAKMRKWKSVEDCNWELGLEIPD